MSLLTFLQKVFAPKKRIIGATDLRRALTNNEFVFYYQPEWDLKTGSVRGIEALIRWESPNGIIPPNEFIPKLEETGIINDFTPFLFKQTFKDLRTLRDNGFTDLFLSINLSASQLRNPSLLTLLDEAMDEFRILPEQLECELTETNALSKSGVEIQTLKNLKKQGIRISIDDFGSGHASLNYVKDLEADKLKIDGDFINTLFDKQANQSITRMMIDLGHALNLLVLAEGIERPEQEQWLKENNCDFGQGFIFSRPLPLPMLLSFLKQQQQTNEQKSE